MGAAHVISRSLVVVGAAVVLGGCAPRGVEVPPGADDLVQCAPRQIPVDELAGTGAPGCDLVGSAIVFPDGTVMEVAPVGVASGTVPDTSEPVEMHLLNWGVPGVGSSLVDEGRAVGMWASSSAALDLQRQQMAVEGIATEE